MGRNSGLPGMEQCQLLSVLYRSTRSLDMIVVFDRLVKQILELVLTNR